MKRRKNLKKLLNLNMVDYTNLTTKLGELDMPYICCNVVPKVDYLANYSQPSTYFKTQNTAVSFFEFDVVFDGLYGLWNSIYFRVAELQEFYEERFKEVRFFIAPDYSKCGDVVEVENQYRQLKMRLSSIWLSLHTNAVVIPLVSCGNKREMEYMLDGMEKCVCVAFNAKGPMGNPRQMEIFKESIKYTVDHLKHLKSIIVYSSSPNHEKVLSIFEYAVQRGIEIQIPDNMLQSRNRLKGGDPNDIAG